MSALSLPILLSVAASCPGTAVSEGRIKATLRVESGLDPLAIHDNADGHPYRPQSLGEAVATARRLLALGHRIDAGAMQITDRNWRWLGLDEVSVFDPKRNICAAVHKLQMDYAIEMRVSCRYNAGRPDCPSEAPNSYPKKIEAAWFGTGDTLTPPTPAPAPPLPAVMVSAMRDGGPPVPVLPSTIVDAVIHRKGK